MTSIATRNGEAIVKSGSVGTDCGCCVGACCNGASCAVVQQSQCQGEGKSFQGIGTTCNPNPCGVCVCRQQFSSPETMFKPSVLGEVVSVQEAATRTVLPMSVTAVFYSSSTDFSPPASFFTGTYVLQRTTCQYLWGSTFARNGSQWGVYFGVYPPSSSTTVYEPAVWFTNSLGAIVSGAAFYLANYAASAQPNGVNMATAMNRICYGGAIEYSSRDGSTTASVSPNPLP